MLYKWVQELISKYSFINRVEYKFLYIYFYYNIKNVEKYKRLSFRANKKHVQHMIEKIRKEINYYEEKKVRDKKIKADIKAEAIMFARV